LNVASNAPLLLALLVLLVIVAFSSGTEVAMLSVNPLPDHAPRAGRPEHRSGAGAAVAEARWTGWARTS